LENIGDLMGDMDDTVETVFNSTEQKQRAEARILMDL
jgi:hypothetical protein